MAKSKKNSSNIPSAETLEQATSTTTALVSARGPSPGMISLLAARSIEDSGKKVKRLTLPPIVPPAQVGLGVAIEGEVIRVVPSPVATYKSELLVMRHPTGQEYCFPATAVIIGAFASHQKCDRKDVDLEQTVGLNLIIKGLGPKKMQGTASDGKTQRSVNLFEVFIVE